MAPRGRFASYSCPMRSTISGWAVWSGALAGLSFVTSGTMLADIVDKRTAAVLVLLTGGLQAATSAYQQALRASSTQKVESP